MQAAAEHGLATPGDDGGGGRQIRAEAGRDATTSSSSSRRWITRSSSGRLQRELQQRRLELEKIESLDEKIATELTQLEEKKTTMEDSWSSTRTYQSCARTRRTRRRRPRRRGVRALPHR